MTPAPVRTEVVAERIAWVRQMVSRTRSLPLDSLAAFLEDPRNAGAAESYLRRGIEALLDIGRHILAKGFGIAAGEYKEIGPRLVEQRVLDAEKGLLLRRIAGYRNRMVHFYNEVSAEELYGLCTGYVSDLETLCDAFVQWMQSHPEFLDRGLLHAYTPKRLQGAFRATGQGEPPQGGLWRRPAGLCRVAQTSGDDSFLSPVFPAPVPRTDHGAGGDRGVESFFVQGRVFGVEENAADRAVVKHITERMLFSVRGRGAFNCGRVVVWRQRMAKAEKGLALWAK